MLYTLRYRQHPLPGPISAVLEAEGLSQAIEASRIWCARNSPPEGSLIGRPKQFIQVEPFVTFDARELLAEPQPPQSSVDWEARTAVSRLAEMQGKTEEQVRAELRSMPAPPAPAPEEPAGVLVDARRKLREMLRPT